MRRRNGLAQGIAPLRIALHRLLHGLHHLHSGGAQIGRIHHRLAQMREIAPGQPQDIGARRGVDGAVNGRARLAVQLDLRRRQPKAALQLGIREHHASGIHVIGLHQRAILAARVAERALEQGCGHGLAIGGAHGALAQIAPALQARQQARRKVGGVIGKVRHIVNELLRRLVNGLEQRLALGQIAHGAHRLVPPAYRAGVIEHAVKLLKRAFPQARRFVWRGFDGFWRAAAEVRIRLRLARMQLAPACQMLFR